eukprot:m.137319 g.137319  ORF g.137319 m.137319 type:complete len:215 (-) comp13970_c0_seq2:92-736(-)
MPHDHAEAARLYRLSADQGYAVAQCNLGICFKTGQSELQDHTEAARLFRLSADQGYVVAQCNLAICYANGKGVPRDHAEAARLYRLSAEQGDAKAQRALGDCYLNGTGVEWNPAIVYLSRGSHPDNPDATERTLAAKERVIMAKRARSRLGSKIKRHSFLTTAVGRHRVTVVLQCASRLRLDDSKFPLPILPPELWLVILGQLSLSAIEGTASH